MTTGDESVPTESSVLLVFALGMAAAMLAILFAELPVALAVVVGSIGVVSAMVAVLWTVASVTAAPT